MPEPCPDQPFGGLDFTPPLPVLVGSRGAAFLHRLTATTTEDYCIRLATYPGTPCAECGASTGVGPIGNRDGEPLCDECLLEHCHELGMVLAVASAARRLARSEEGSDERRDALEMLAEMAWRYEEVAGETGPPRRVDLP